VPQPKDWGAFASWCQLMADSDVQNDDDTSRAVIRRAVKFIAGICSRLTDSSRRHLVAIANAWVPRGPLAKRNLRLI
jgi:hypothetical protein